MKTLIEVPNDGLEALMGRKIILFCANYFYTGKLIGASKTYVKLENPAIVYETGDFKDSKYKDEQSLCQNEWYVRLSAVESFGLAK